MIRFSLVPSTTCHIVFVSASFSFDHALASDTIKNTINTIRQKPNFTAFAPFPVWDNATLWLVIPLSDTAEYDAIFSVATALQCMCKTYHQSLASVHRAEFLSDVQWDSILQAIYSAEYEFSPFFGPITKEEQQKKNLLFSVSLEIIAQENTKYKALYDGISLTKNLVNLPPSQVTPEYFVQHAEKIFASIENITIKIISLSELESLGMNGIVSVGKCASVAPRMLLVEYLPLPKQNPLVVVGKGVTYDTGGLSLKTGGSMRSMKRDMAGAATVLGSVFTAAQLKLQKNIVAIMPLAENAIGPNAYKPDDIITMANGITVEVTNTDAEGRLLLGDALWYAQKYYTPSAVIDFATLTGACQYAVGDEISAVFCNNDHLMNQLKQVSEKINEPIWQLPLYAPYKKKIRSKIADIVNAASDFPAGTIQAALFLQYFIHDSIPWAHFDIAFTAFDKKTELATARHVKTIIELLESL